MNLDDNPRMHEQFELSHNIPRIVLVIQFETEEVVPEGGSLVVLDKIQACPKPRTCSPLALPRDDHAGGEADPPPAHTAEPRAEDLPHLALGVDMHVPFDGMRHPRVHDGARGRRLPDVADHEGAARAQRSPHLEHRPHRIGVMVERVVAVNRIEGAVVEGKALRVAYDHLRTPAEALGSTLDHVRRKVDPYEGACLK